MAAEMSLFRLLDLSIDAPQFSTVNYSALHSLLRQILKLLQVQGAIPEEEEEVGGKGVSQFTVPIEEQQDEISETKKFQDALQSELEGLEEQVSESMVPVEYQQSEIAELKESWDDFQSGLDYQQDELTQDSQSEITEPMESRDDLQRELMDQEEQLSQDHVKVILEPEESEDALQGEVKSLQRQLQQECVEDILDLKESQDALQNELMSLQDQLSQYHLTDIVQLKESHNALQSEVKGLQEELFEFIPVIHDYLKEVHELEESQDALQSELKTLEEQLSQSMAEIQDHLREILEMKECQNELKGLQEQMSQDHLKYILELKESQDVLQNELKSLQEQLSQLMDHIQEQKNEIVELKEYRDTFQNEIKGLKEKLSQLEKRRAVRENVMVPPGSMLTRGRMQQEVSADIDVTLGPQYQHHKDLEGLVTMEGDGRTVEGSEMQVLSRGGVEDLDLEPGQRVGYMWETSDFSLSPMDSQEFHRHEQLQSLMMEGDGRTVEGSEMQSLSEEVDLDLDPQQRVRWMEQEGMTPGFTMDISRRAGHQFLRHEQIHGTVGGLMMKEGSSRITQGFDMQTKDLLSEHPTQANVLQLQKQCEKLSGTTLQLVESQTQQQKQIDLYRRETELMKKKLQNCWEVICKLVQAETDSEVDNAAVTRKQIPAHYHCLSCNRRIDMMTTVLKPPLSTATSLPSQKPFPLRKAEEVHSQRQPEGVQSQAAGQEQPLDRKQVLSRFPPIQGTTVPQHEQIQELPTWQSCGGSQTLTFVKQRYTPLQRVSVLDKEKVDILGNDGHLYKGCAIARGMEPRSPIISKEGYSLSLKGQSILTGLPE
ncbi:uncharacterized protein LOC108936894 [Arapaima gigas]